jgi:hypothetical protein
MRDRITHWLDERPVRLAVCFAIAAAVMAAASVYAWVEPGYAGGRESRRATTMYLGPVLTALCAWAALKLWKLDRRERGR